MFLKNEELTRSKKTVLQGNYYIPTHTKKLYFKSYLIRCTVRGDKIAQWIKYRVDNSLSPEPMYRVLKAVL